MIEGWYVTIRHKCDSTSSAANETRYCLKRTISTPQCSWWGVVLPETHHVSRVTLYNIEASFFFRKVDLVRWLAHGSVLIWTFFATHPHGDPPAPKVTISPPHPPLTAVTHNNYCRFPTNLHSLFLCVYAWHQLYSHEWHVLCQQWWYCWSTMCLTVLCEFLVPAT